MIRFSLRSIIDEPIIDVNQLPQLEDNANGPSLIRIPDWVENPLAKYYLYFGHHKGQNIRLACSDNLNGRWLLQTPPLTLADSLFPDTVPLDSNLDKQVKQDIANGLDGNYPHIASPDVFIDEANQQIRLYYHGRSPDGRQMSRVAISSDGLNFTAQPEILGAPYFRVFKLKGYYYAIAMPGILYRSADGLTNFDRGPQLTDQSIRHVAVHRYHNSLYVFWTRVGDAPESVLCSKLLTDDAWSNWRLGPEHEVHRPLKSWEGANQPCVASEYGVVMQPVNQLRDPAIFNEKEKTWLLFSVAGEQGIGIGELIASDGK